MSNESVASWVSYENDGFSDLSDTDEENPDSSSDFNFTWRIQNFSLCSHKNGEVLLSPVIKEPRFNSQWFVEFYPRGFKNDGFISLYLREKNFDKYISTDVTFFASIINGNCVRIKDDKRRKVFLKKGERLGWAQFMKLVDLEEFTSNSEDDIISINCIMRCRRFPQKFPAPEVNTEIGIDRNTFLWNVEIPDESQICKTEFAFSGNLLLQISMLWIKGELQIRIRPKHASNLFIRCKLSLQGAKGNSLKSKTANYSFEKNGKNEVWDFPNFITSMTISANKISFVKKNTLTLFFEFSVSNGTISSQTMDNTVSNEDDCLILMDDIKYMFLNRVNSDVEFKVDSEIVHAHKSILSARSPVFFAMFKQNMKESRIGTVDILDASANTLKLFLEFVYTGKVELESYSRVKKLLMIANKYEVLSLKEKCVSFLKLELSLLNACEILITADLICHQHLKRVAMDFIAMNSAIIFNTPEWLDLVKKHFKLSGEVFSNIGANFSLFPNNSSACKTDNWYQERKSKKRKICY